MLGQTAPNSFRTSDRTDRVGRWIVLGAVCAFLLLTTSAAPAAGADRQLHPSLESAGPRTGRLTLAASIEIEPLRAEEILRGGGGGVLPFDGAAPVLSLEPAFTSRTLDSLWRLQLDTARSAQPIQVDYELIGVDGRKGVLNQPGAPERSIDVRLEPHAPLRTQTAQGLVELEGGLTIHLDLGQIRHAGNYGGTLVISLNHL